MVKKKTTVSKAKPAPVAAMPAPGEATEGTLEQITQLIDMKVGEAQQAQRVAAENIARLTGYNPGQAVDAYAVVKIVQKVFRL